MSLVVINVRELTADQARLGYARGLIRTDESGGWIDREDALDLGWHDPADDPTQPIDVRVDGAPAKVRRDG